MLTGDLKPRVGQTIVMAYASPTAKDFILELISTFPVHSPSFFLQTSPELAVAYARFCIGLKNEKGQPARCHGRLMQVPVLSAHGL